MKLISELGTLVQVHEYIFKIKKKKPKYAMENFMLDLVSYIKKQHIVKKMLLIGH